MVNADDFGFTHDVNAGIVEAHQRGILTAATLMANGAAFADAVRLARQTPTLDVGCHLVLVSGKSILTGAPLPQSVGALLRAIALRRIDVYAELAAQIRHILEAGIQPTHLDTHKHTHIAPPVLDAVARAAGEFGIRWVRRPFDFPLTAAAVARRRSFTSGALGLLRRRFHSVLDRQGCRMTDHFAGFQVTGVLRTAELVALIRGLPEGTTELMTHPGRCTAELRAARTRLKQSREEELRALTAPETRRVLEECGVELAGYRAL